MRAVKKGDWKLVKFDVLEGAVRETQLFNLAENRRDPDFPFAFMATYTNRLSAAAKAQHVPLAQALKEYAGDRDKLLNLLLPVSRAAESTSDCSARSTDRPTCDGSN